MQDSMTLKVHLIQTSFPPFLNETFLRMSLHKVMRHIKVICIFIPPVYYIINKRKSCFKISLIMCLYFAMVAFMFIRKNGVKMSKN